MRALILGYPLPNISFDNYNFVSAPSFFDYDAVVVDPANITRVIEDVINQSEELNTFFMQPVANAPTSPYAVGLADQLIRRRDETARILAKGGLVVCFLRPNVVHGNVAGFAGCDRYYWLPAPAGVIYGGNQLLPGEGQQTVITDPSHPFARYFERQNAILRYHAYWAEERMPNFATYGHIFARSVGGAAIGVDFSVGGGHIVFLPSPDALYSGDSRYALAETIANCLEAHLREVSDEPSPSWIGAYDLPGLAQLIDAERRAADRYEQARSDLTIAQNKTEQLSKYRCLLWQEGKFGLEAIVRDSLRLLGFEVTDDLDEPAVISAAGQAEFLEVEGSTKEVGMEPHYRLRKRREDELQKSGAYPNGLVVVNGHRLLPPEDRQQEYTEALRVAAESTRYCLLTTTQLFDFINQALAGAKEEALRGIRDAILNTEGVLQPSEDATTNSSVSEGAFLDSEQ